MNVAEMLEGKRVCVCAGSGGVGKTTTSAAIALGMAAAGAKVAVVTIDPAKRLANALGLEQLENEPHRVEPERLAGASLEVKGELWAMMLDPKRTFDELIDRIAPDPARAEEIKANRVYRELSTAVSGSQEFTAIAKLYELDQESQFDLLVLDTPPSRNALDFLDAPGRLNAFLEGRALKAFMRPTGLGMRVLGRGALPLLAGLRRVTGIDLISDLSTFFQLLGDMTSDFSQRAAQVEQLLRRRAPRSCSSPRPPASRSTRRSGSASGSRPTACRSPAWSSTASTTTCSATARRARCDARWRGCLPPGLASPRGRELPRLPRAGPARRHTTSSAWPASSTSAGCCSSPSSTTTCTTSRACVRVHRYLFGYAGRARAADRRSRGLTARSARPRRSPRRRPTPPSAAAPPATRRARPAPPPAPAARAPSCSSSQTACSHSAIRSLTRACG